MKSCYVCKNRVTNWQEIDKPKHICVPTRGLIRFNLKEENDCKDYVIRICDDCQFLSECRIKDPCECKGIFFT